MAVDKIAFTGSAEVARLFQVYAGDPTASRSGRAAASRPS